MSVLSSTCRCSIRKKKIQNPLSLFNICIFGFLAFCSVRFCVDIHICVCKMQLLRTKTAITSIVLATTTPTIRQITTMATPTITILNGAFGNNFHGHMLSPNKIDGVSLRACVCVCLPARVCAHCLVHVVLYPMILYISFVIIFSSKFIFRSFIFDVVRLGVLHFWNNCLLFSLFFSQ